MAEHPWCTKHFTYFVMLADNTQGCPVCAGEATHPGGAAYRGQTPTWNGLGMGGVADETGSAGWEDTGTGPGDPCSWCRTVHSGTVCPTATSAMGEGLLGAHESPQAHWASEQPTRSIGYEADESHEQGCRELWADVGMTVIFWDNGCQVQGQGGHRAPCVPMVGLGVCRGLARRVVHKVDEEMGQRGGGPLTPDLFRDIAVSCYREQQEDQSAALEVNEYQRTLGPTHYSRGAPWPMEAVVPVTFLLENAANPDIAEWHIVLVVADAHGFTIADPNLGVVQCAFLNWEGSLANVGLDDILCKLYTLRREPVAVIIRYLDAVSLVEFME